MSFNNSPRFLSFKKQSFIKITSLLLLTFFAIKIFHKEKAPLYINKSSDHSFDKSLLGTLKIARKKTGIDYAVILLKETPEKQSLESLANKYFQEYKIGSKTEGKGMLLLFSQNPPEMKIEVSKALEGVFPDIICSDLEEAAKSFVIKDNIRNYIAEFIITSGLYYLKDPFAQSAQKISQSKSELTLSISPDVGGLSRLSAGAGVLSRNYKNILEKAYHEVLREPSAFDNLYSPSTNAKESVERYLMSLENGNVSSKLPLLTMGSQLFRVEYPKTANFLKRNYRYYQDAGHYQLHESSHLAAALFKAGNPVWPILLVKNNKGEWLVDEAKAWSYFHQFEDSNDFQTKYVHPYLFAWIEENHPVKNYILYQNKSNAAPLIGDPESLLEKISIAQEKLKQEPKNASRYFELADLFYFEMYWMEEAKQLVKEGLKLEADNLAYNWRLVDLNMNTDDIEGVLSSMKKITQRWPSDLATQAWYYQLKDLYD